MKLSIIIPVYNVEKYIKKCLESCFKQDVAAHEYEVIIVNDGTPDNSMTIVEQFAKEYANLKIVNQENRGLSAARNVGLKYAKGEYVWFIDADDYIEHCCLKRIFSQLNEDLDILQLQYRLTFENSNKKIPMQHYSISKSISGLQLIREYGFLPVASQFSIYRKLFLQTNKLQFTVGIYYEDLDIRPRVLWYAKTISFDSKISYNYLQRVNGSITSVFKFRNAQDLIAIMNNVIEFVVNNKISGVYKRKFYSYIGLCMNQLLFGFQFLEQTEKHSLYQELKKNKFLFSYLLKSGNLKYFIAGIIFYSNIKIGLWLHKILRGNNKKY